MTWNYRAILKDNFFQIHEVYYTKDGKIRCWAAAGICPIGETAEELENDLKYMLEAFKKPALREEWDDKRKKHRLIELL